jgi:hypothetical protein
MPEDPEERDHQTPGPDDAGAPLEFLEQMSAEPSAQFLDRVHLKIHRRVVASHLVSLFWDIPGIVFPELWALVIAQVKSGKEG